MTEPSTLHATETIDEEGLVTEKSDYFLFTNQFWYKASKTEREKAQHLYLSLLSRGRKPWNSWATGLLKFIETNSLDKAQFKIHLEDIKKLEPVQNNHPSFMMSGYVFPIEVSFNRSTFINNHVIEFDYSIFLEKASFRETKFTRYCSFEQTTFKSYVDFIGTSFESGADFDESTFESKAFFDDCTFKKYTGFYRCKFNDKLTLKSSNTYNCFFFKEVEILGDADLSDNVFHETAELNNSTFHKGSTFRNSTFNKASTFEKVSFLKSVPDFNFCEFKQPPFLSQIKIPEIYSTGEQSNTENYRRLKSLAIDSHDHEQELLFFSYEMKSKMVIAGHEQSTRSFTPLKLYEVTSNFGRSISRPFTCLVSLLLLSMILHYTIIPPVSECRGKSVYSKEVAVVSYSVSHSLPLFLSDKRAKKATDDCLFGIDQPPSLLIQFIGFFQSLLSAVFAFLIGLGVRNRFKIK